MDAEHFSDVSLFQFQVKKLTNFTHSIICKFSVPILRAARALYADYAWPFSTRLRLFRCAPQLQPLLGVPPI